MQNMDSEGDRKRKKDKNRDDEYRKEKKSRRTRSRSRSPERNRDSGSRRKRRHSRSQSPRSVVKQEKPTDNTQKNLDVKSDPPQRKAKETDMLNTRTGGAYIPPARLRMMQAQITDKSSMAYQRLAWEALKKSIHGHINKINVGNIGIIIKELLKENIVRGRGLLCRSVIQAQAASPTFTNVYAALVAAVNSRFPNIGELLLKRLVIQFKRGFKRNDKPICISSASFIAHLVNQRVAHEILALELLTLLVETPTDDSVEVSIAFLKECGQKLTEVSSKGVNAIFEMLRNILHEGHLDKRVQYMIEVMFQVWKDGFKDHPALIEELELVPEEDQFTHLLMLDDATDSQDILNVFKFDDKYEENEQKYKTLCKEILGSDAESGEEDESGESGSEESDDDEDKQAADKGVTIIDNTETNLVALRRTIYLTINSSLDFEECAHKLMKMQLKPGQEVELCHMFLDCCAEQRTYEKFYGLLAQRFCNINRIYIGPFEEIFKDSYSTAHRLDTNRLRNVSKFFAHLLFTDSISWEVLSCVKLNEEDTTSSSRIYIKILFQELAEYMGLKKLNDRLKDPTLHEAFLGVFPRDNPKNTRFSINFFTSIGLGGLTDELREHLKQMPKNVPPAITEIQVDSDSSSSSSSSSDSSSDSSSGSSSDSEDEGGKEKTKEKKKSKADKSKTSKNDEQNKDNSPKERWGHDGFYETYGKDARRHDSRPNNQRDDDNFTRPRDPDRRRNDRDYERQNERSNDGRRQRDDKRNDERDRYRENDRQDDFRNKRDNNRLEEDHRRNVSSTDKNQDNYRKKDSYNQEDPRKQSDRVDKNYDDRRRQESGNDVDSRKQRDKEDRYQDKNRRNESNEDADPRKQKDKEDRYQDKSRRNEPNEVVDSRKQKDTEDRYREKSRRNESNENADPRKQRNKEDRYQDKGRRNESNEVVDSRKQKEKGRNRKNDDYRSEDNDGRRKRQDIIERKDSNDEEHEQSQKSKSNKRQSNESSDEESEVQGRNDRKVEKSKKEKSKDKKRRKDKDDTDSSSDDSEQRVSKKYDKENKNKGDRKSRKDTEDESKQTKRKKDKKRVEEEDGWDIRRAESVRREEIGRYWDNHVKDTISRETPERKTKNRSRRDS